MIRSCIFSSLPVSLFTILEETKVNEPDISSCIWLEEEIRVGEPLMEVNGRLNNPDPSPTNDPENDPVRLDSIPMGLSILIFYFYLLNTIDPTNGVVKVTWAWTPLKLITSFG